MTVEVSTYISQLNSALPAVGDLKSEGDEHIRKIKANLQATFPNLTAAAVTASTTELNYVTGVTSAIQTQLNAKAATTYVDAEIIDALGGGATWTPAGTGAVARTVQSGFRQVVSVKDFGALGDNSNDDTAEIQAALDYAGTIVQNVVTNKVDIVTAKVLLPAGRYKTSAVLTIPEGVSLEGESSSTAIILPQHTGVALQMGGSSREYSQIKVRGIGIIGKWTGTMSYGAWSTTTTVGIYVENCIRECYIEDCFISQCNKSIQVENSYAFEINNNYLSSAKTYHIEWDVAVNGTIRGNRIDWAEDTGIYLNGTNSADETIGVLIEANAIQICWKDAIRLYDCSSATILNNFFESNYRLATAATYTYADINIVTGPNLRGYSFSVIGNFFTHGSSPDLDVYTAIKCDKAVSLICTGNVCRDSWYYRFIDANTSSVQRIVALGNAYSGTFSKIVYDSATCFGILEEVVSDGSIAIPKFIAGSIQFAAAISSSNQTTSEYKTTYLINCSGGNRQVNLRDADCVAGRMYIAKKTDAGAVNTLKFIPEGGSTKTIDGAAQLATTAAYGVLRVVSDGTNWFSL